jgi:hypothetical protein
MKTGEVKNAQNRSSVTSLYYRGCRGRPLVLSGRIAMFRISSGMDWPIVEVESAAEIMPAIRAALPGWYHIDEITTKPLPFHRTARRWGIVIKRGDGSVVIGRDPWDN